MKWIAIAGTWRITTPEVERDVRHEVRECIRQGHGIVTGGALGVDYWATDEALLCDPTAKSVIICLPTNLQAYKKHYSKRANEGVITQTQADNLITQLETIAARNPEALHEAEFAGELNQVSYFARISTIVSLADELLAFQVNKSEGTQDTINKAEAKGIPVKVLSYTVPAESSTTSV